MKKQINALLVIGIIGTAIFGSHFATKYGEAMWGNKDIWWTPMSMALPLDETKQEFEIYVKGELMQKHLDRGTLSYTDKAGQTSRLAPHDIKVRLNNWNKTKASMLLSAAISAVILGISLTLLIMGIIQFVKKEKKNSQQNN